jgi:hypothetical protein
VTIQRSLSTEFRTAAEASASREVFLTFATLWHPALTRIVRVVNDVVDYEFGGAHFIGCPFDVVLLSDSEGRPSAQLSLQNVDQIIGESVQSLSDSPRLKFEVVLASQFSVELDDAVGENGARVELGETIIDYTADHLRLAKVQVDAMFVTGEIHSYDYSQEPLPYYRAVKSRFPGLYR